MKLYRIRAKRFRPSPSRELGIKKNSQLFNWYNWQNLYLRPFSRRRI